MKIAIVGGHLTPALAIIKALPKEVGIVYIGRKHPAAGDRAVSLEFQTINEMGIPFISLTTGKFERAFTKHTIGSFIKMPRGMTQAFTLLRKYQPDVIISFGGYLSVPICFSSYLLKIPFVVHEQTTQAGLSNKLLAFFAKKICISFPSSAAFFPKEKTILTGNPILMSPPTSAFRLYDQVPTDKPLLVVTGGSQGSHAINALIEQMLPELVSSYSIIHQTGDAKQFGDYDRLSILRQRLLLKKNYLPVRFIHPFDMWHVFKKSDLVISRAGINSVLTLLLQNKPAIFIPLPHGQKNEQLRNAQMFAKTGLGILMRQNDTTARELKKQIDHMIENKKNYQNKELEAMRSMHLGAAQRVIDVVMRV